MAAGDVLRDLGNGLILRRATIEDAQDLAAFYMEAFRQPDEPDPNPGFLAATHDHLHGPRPTYGPDNFTIVEDTASGAIVSSIGLLSQTWTYGGIEFAVGRIEPVATHAKYRRRGLVRAQFEVAHQWSAERGELAQAITGIPYFYRQFGYEMTIELGGGREGSKANVPSLKDGQQEPCLIRPATTTDLPFIKDTDERGSSRYLVTCRRDEALWRHELCGRMEGNFNGVLFRILEAPSGERLGYFAYHPRPWRGTLGLRAYELTAGHSWAAVTPTVLRYLKQVGEAYAAEHGGQIEPFERLAFHLGTEHPAYAVLASVLPQINRPYAFYMRVPDLSAFLSHIAPVLEQRLAASPLAGHGGELRLSFYRSGLRLSFEQGKLTQVESWQPGHAEDGDAAFPDLTFLKLLFGYRDLTEIRHAFPDCWCRDDVTEALLSALFPKRPSLVWAVN